MPVRRISRRTGAYQLKPLDSCARAGRPAITPNGSRAPAGCALTSVVGIRRRRGPTRQTAEGVVTVATFCEAATGSGNIDTVTGLPGPGAVIFNNHAEWSILP